MNLTGLDSINSLINRFDKFDQESDKMFDEALFDGAAVVADEVKSKIESIPVEEKANGKPYWGTPNRKLTGITSIQKDGLRAGFGIASFRKEGNSTTTAIGFDGYNANGEPNQMIARVVESGNSFRQKRPFMRPAMNAAKGRAEEAMKKKILEKAKEI